MVRTLAAFGWFIDERRYYRSTYLLSKKAAPVLYLYFSETASDPRMCIPVYPEPITPSLRDYI